MNDRDVVVEAASRLDIRPVKQKWAHLSLSVLDAVFSVGARTETTRQTCLRYAEAHGLEPFDRGLCMEPVIGTGAEQRLSEFVEHVRERGVDGFASSVLRNRQTIPVDPTVLKAEVALRLGEIFVDRGIERYADVSPALSDEVRRDELVAGVRAVPGSTTSYAGGWLSRLVGDDDLVEPDPVLVQWIGRAIGRYVEPAEAEALLRAAERSAAGHRPRSLARCRSRNGSDRP